MNVIMNLVRLIALKLVPLNLQRWALQMESNRVLTSVVQRMQRTLKLVIKLIMK